MGGGAVAATEAEFERELAAFGIDVTLATRYFYALQSTYYLASRDDHLLRAMNGNMFYWNTSLNAMQEATFIALGRIFDNNERSHSIHQLLDLATQNPDLFSLDALRRRKRGNADEDPDWLDEYMCDRYVPKPADWRRLSKHLTKWSTVFEKEYRPLRHKVYAHRDRLSKAELDSMFATTSYRELERMLAFLSSFEGALWELYFNGRKPVLKPRRYSVVEMIERPEFAKSGGNGQKVALDTKEVLVRILNVKRRSTKASTRPRKVD